MQRMTPKRPKAHASAQWAPLIIPAVSVIGAVIGFAGVLCRDEIWQYVSTRAAVPVLLLGAVGGASYGLWQMSQGESVSPGNLAIRTGVGTVFGFAAAQTAIGIGLNENLQTAATLIGGGTGPKYLDAAVERMIGEKPE